MQQGPYIERLNIQHNFFLLFSIPLLFLFFWTILFPFATFVYAHSSTLPFPLLFFVVFQWHSLHPCYYEFQNFNNAHDFQQQMQTTFDSYSIFFCP
jgi:hypothetical protein